MSAVEGPLLAKPEVQGLRDARKAAAEEALNRARQAASKADAALILHFAGLNPVTVCGTEEFFRSREVSISFNE